MKEIQRLVRRLLRSGHPLMGVGRSSPAAHPRLRTTLQLPSSKPTPFSLANSSDSDRTAFVRAAPASVQVGLSRTLVSPHFSSFPTRLPFPCRCTTTVLMGTA